MKDNLDLKNPSQDAKLSYNYLDKSKICIGIFLDMPKAFVTIYHQS